MNKVYKCLVLAFVFVACAYGVKGQEYRSFSLESMSFDKNGLYYSLPQTELIFDVEVEKITEYKGCFADYSYMLGLKNVVTKDGVTYRIKDIKIRPEAVADASQTYFMNTEGGINIVKSDIGSLSVISKKTEVKDKDADVLLHPKDVPHPPKEPKTMEKDITNPTIAQRLLSEGMLESMPNMTAEKAIKEIERLKELQLDVLSGSTDGTYMNTTVDFMYKQLDRIIEGYVAMFSGERVVEKIRYSFSVIPQKPLIVEEDLMLGIFKFSEKDGVLPLTNTDKDVTAIVANIHSFNTTKNYAKIEEQKSHNDKIQSSIAKKGVGVYYRIPETVNVSVNIADKSFKKTLKISQFGVVSYLMDSPSKIVFDDKTGALKFVSKD